MAQVLIEVNGRPYGVGCEEGQESHVRELAEVIDAKAREVAPTAGAVGETRVMLMAALMLADEVSTLRESLKTAEARLAGSETLASNAEARAIEVLENAAQKLEALAAAR